MQARALWLVPAALIFALDRWTKMWVESEIPLYSSETVIPGFFNLVHARNTGIAFSLFADSAEWVREGALPIISAIAVIGLLAYLFRTSSGNWRLHLALTLVLAGAAGNLYDRAMYGYVTDFLDFYVGGWHWPAFNVADSAITVGAGVLLLESLWGAESAETRRQPKSA